MGLARGETRASIALRLGRSKSTISREVSRHVGVTGYRAFSAGRASERRASSRRYGKRRLVQEERLCTHVLSGLRKRWSPCEIVRHMGIAHPQVMSMHISHEVVYQYVYVLPRGSLKKTCLPSAPRA